MHWIKIIKLNQFTCTIYTQEFQSVTVQKRVGTDSTGVLTNFGVVEVVQLLFCCASKQTRGKAACRGFSWGCWTRRDASFGPSVRLLRRLKGFLLCSSRLTHVKLKATLHSHYITYHLGPPPRIHMAFRGVYGGSARHLAACAMIRSIRSLFFPIPLRISSPTPLRSEDSGCAVWGMTIHFLRF